MTRHHRTKRLLFLFPIVYEIRWAIGKGNGYTDDFSYPGTVFLLCGAREVILLGTACTAALGLGPLGPSSFLEGRKRDQTHGGCPMSGPKVAKFLDR